MDLLSEVQACLDDAAKLHASIARLLALCVEEHVARQVQRDVERAEGYSGEVYDLLRDGRRYVREYGTDEPLEWR